MYKNEFYTGLILLSTVFCVRAFALNITFAFFKALVTSALLILAIKFRGTFLCAAIIKNS